MFECEQIDIELYVLFGFLEGVNVAGLFLFVCIFVYVLDANKR